MARGHDLAARGKGDSVDLTKRTSRDGQLLYAADSDNAIVAVVDTSQLSLLATVKVGAGPERVVVGPDAWVGLSTHNVEQFEKAARSSADYIAVGPIFATTSKADPDPIVGLHLIRRVRRLTKRPIVAIGGITLERAAEVIEAGADSVAVINDILGVDDPVSRAREYLRRLEAAEPAANQ